MVHDNDKAMGSLLFYLQMPACLKISYPYTSVYFSLCTCLWVDLVPIYTACQLCASDNKIDSGQSYAYMGNRWTI